jgi:predicted phage tail protein
LITVDNAGNKSDPETLFTFRYDNVAPSNPPGATEVNGVAQDTWQKDHDTPNFSLTSAGTDAHSGVSGYLVYFGNDNGATPASSETFEYSPGQQESGTYYLRVITLDNAGNQSDDTATLFTFKLDKTPPTDPDSLVTTDPATDSTPTFTWDVSTDEHSGMVGSAGYQVEWDAINSCDNAVTNFDDANSYTAPSPIPSGTPYYICVRAVDALGNEGNWIGPTSHIYVP